ncbi:protein DJ-1-like D-like, partial [Trifolium medium]|nr:protein DJ-1-like D-like [Trifolium medium]
TCTAYPPVKPVLIAAGAHWVEPDTLSTTVVDGNLITAPTYEGHPELLRHFVKALGGKISGSDKKILFICGVTCYCLYTNIYDYVAPTLKIEGVSECPTRVR